MKGVILLMLIVGLVSARPSCGYYPYYDFVWEENYAAPVRPADTLLDNCGSVGVDSSICDELSNPNLTTSEKKQLILDGLVKNSSAPDFQTAKEWNDELQFTKYAPDNVPTSTSQNIRDAWLKIVAIHPSLYSGNELLINGTGEIRAAYNFTFVVKKESFPGDCATEYEICGYNYALDKQLGSDKAGATLAISTQYLIHHSHLVTHCFSSPTGTVCFTTCEYSHSDDKRDALTLSDELAVKNYLANYTAFSFIESYQNKLVDGWLVFNASDEFNRAKFTLGNSYILYRGIAYKLAANLTPYNAITPEAVDSPNDFEFYEVSILERENISNGSQRYEKIHFLAPAEVLNCTFDFAGHFTNTHEIDFCNLSEEVPIINLTLANRTNESVLVHLRFFDNKTGDAFAKKSILLSYGNQSINLTTDSNGEAEYQLAYSPYSSLVHSEFKTDFQTKSAETYLVVPSEFPITIYVVFYLLTLLFAFYLFYDFSRRLNYEK